MASLRQFSATAYILGYHLKCTISLNYMYIFDHPSTFLSPSIQTANISKTNWCFLCKWTWYSKEMIRYGCYCKTKARLADNSRREFLLLSTTNAIGHSVLQLAHQWYASHIGLWIPKILGFSQVPSSRFHRADDGSVLAGHRCCKSCLWGPVVSVVVLVVVVRLPLRFIDHRSSSNSPRPPNAFPMYSSCYENNLH